MNIRITMYFLNVDRVPCNSMFSDIEVVILATLMNIALQNRHCFQTFKKLSPDAKRIFETSFERTPAFMASGTDRKYLVIGHKEAIVFYRLLWETIEKIYKDQLDNNLDTRNLLDFTNEYATNDKYTKDRPQVASNHAIVKFCIDTMHNACFVGSAFGFKNAFSPKPRAVISLFKDNELDIFCKKSLQLIMVQLKKVLNLTPFDAHLTREGSHDLASKVILSNDFGVSLTPVDRNKSLIINGLIARKVLSKMLQVRRAIEKAYHATDIIIPGT
jgi:hypothetical protein